jgi:hypothetical protein
MKVELHVNGTRELWLTATDELEALQLKLMADASQKGVATTLTPHGDHYLLSVPK